jgi:ATP-dependent RNA helicase DeaD
MGFRKMALTDKTIMALEELGYYKPTEVQEKVIPLILQGENLIVRSQTGTGKTAAFGIGLIELLDAERDKKALVLAPTRELAVQISEELKGIAKEHHHKIVVVYGGQKIDIQMRELKKGVDILIATPGRLVDHSERGTVNLREYNIVVLDEADEMLDMGFKDEMDKIMRHIPEQRIVLLFSATLDELILDLASHYIKGPAETLELGEKERVQQIKEDFVQVSRRKKYSNLKRILGQGDYKKVLIFMATKRGVDYLYERLREDGYKAEGTHGDMSQARRERVMASFKAGKTHILVASDVAARGIHVEDIELIVNYDEAQDADTHIHRVGRTGRMGKEGRAVTFIESRDEEDKDRSKEDHPDFAWMKGGGDIRRGPPRGERRGPRPGTSSQDRRKRPRAHEKEGRRNYGPAKKKRRR